MDNESNKAYDARMEREEEIADDIEYLYKGIDAAHLYQNGAYRGYLTLQEALEFALSNSINDIWTINEEEL
jgi:hypothetical protein